MKSSENATFEIPNKGVTIINESGLYSLILSSKLPFANAKPRKTRPHTENVLLTIAQ